MPCDTEFYNILGISPTANEKEIKKGYKKMALKYHPDRNPNNKEESETKFKKVSEAYEILSDNNKRRMYDQFGKDGIKNNGGMNNNSHFDVFNNMFNGGMPDMNNIFNGFGNMGGRRRVRKGQDVIKPLEIPLSAVYNGLTKKIAITRKIKCTTCEGTGCKSKFHIHNCKICKGTGIHTVIRQIGPGMVQQMNGACHACNQTGKTIDSGWECKKCNNGYMPYRHIQEIRIPKGAQHNDKIILRQMGDESREVDLAGDIVFIINIKKHSYFEREGYNLLYKKIILLSESLTGFHFIIEQLDGRTLYISHDDIIYPNQVLMIRNEGLPVKKGNGNKGNLKIEFKIKFPTEINDNVKKIVNKIFPKRKHKEYNIDDINELKLETVPEKEYYSYDIDEEESNDEHNIECNQM